MGAAVRRECVSDDDAERALAAERAAAPLFAGEIEAEEGVR